MKINKILIIFLFFTKFNAGVHTQLRITNKSIIENSVNEGLYKMKFEQGITKVYLGLVNTINGTQIRGENNSILTSLSDEIRNLINDNILTLDVSNSTVDNEEMIIFISQNIKLTTKFLHFDNNPMNNIEIINFEMIELIQNSRNSNNYKGYLECITTQVHPVIIKNKNLKIFFEYFNFIVYVCTGLGMFILSIIFGVNNWKR